MCLPPPQGNPSNHGIASLGERTTSPPCFHGRPKRAAQLYDPSVTLTQDSVGPGDLLELADTAMRAGDYDGAVAHLSAAARAFTVAGDNRRAAMACARVGDLFANLVGNRTAAQPWFRRAIRLVEHEEPCIEQGWVALAALGCDVSDPAVLGERAELALDRARRFGNVDLEIKALADGGLAHVQAGRVSEGMARIDEAMALACGGGTEDDIVVGKSVCSFFTACYVTADFERVETWSPLLRQRGILGAAPGAQAYTSSHCSSLQGTMLCHLGRWGEAEDVLLRAYDAIEQIMPGAGWHPVTALAELRILQGRLSEAEGLLLGHDDHLEALLPTARLYLARGDHQLARATARRGLRMMGDDRVRAASLLGVLVEAELAEGDVAQAAEASAELDTRTAGLGLPTLAGAAARLRARVRSAQGDRTGAITALQEGLDQLAGAELPHLKARLHLDLARLLDGEGDRAEAAVEARTAATLLARLDVVLDPADRDLLRQLSVGTPTQNPVRSTGWPRCAGTAPGGRLPVATPAPACVTPRASSTSPTWSATQGRSVTPSTSWIWSRGCRQRIPASTGAGWATPVRSSTPRAGTSTGAG